MADHTSDVNRRPPVVPLRFGAGLVAIAALMLAMSWGGDTGTWPDGATTEGQVVYVQSRWSAKGGSARVVYEANGVRYERWLPDFDEQGHVGVGDKYLLEYRTGDPDTARGVAANQDDARLEPVTRALGLLAAVLAVAAMVTHFMWRERPKNSPRRSQPDMPEDPTS